MQPAQKWKRRKDARPSELLDAALDEFYEKGFAGARLDDIAARAGVSKGTVYLYFEGKDEMFEALIRAVPLPNVENIKSIVADSPLPADQLLANVLRMVGALLRDPRMMKFPRLIIGEAANFPHIAETYKKEIIDRGIAVMTSVIERGIAQGVFRKIDARNAAFAAMAPLLFLAIWRTTFESFDTNPIEAESFIAQHVENYVRSLKAETVP